MTVVLKVAVTLRACDNETEHVVALPEHAPPQDAKVEPALAAAVNVTEEPDVKLFEQVLPHEIPLGDEVIVPVPEPLLVRVSV